MMLDILNKTKVTKMKEKTIQERKMIQQDLEFICSRETIPWKKLADKTILITGATGLIGSLCVKALAWYSIGNQCPIHILAFVRSLEKADKLFGAYITAGADIRYLTGDITDQIICENPVDYIIHGASATSSKMFQEQPVETALTILKGTENILQFAKEKQAESLVFLSTMEIYGIPQNDEIIEENSYHRLDHLSVRNSYPEAKKMAENLCVGYAAEYHLPVRIARLTQTFGPGATYQDKRVFAEFARCAMEQRPIVLHTKGDTKRSYLYTADAVCAILTILLQGKDANAYNVANESTYCSILEMAKLVAGECSKPPIEVRVEIDDLGHYGYAPRLCMNLGTRKLQELGWQPSVGLAEMYARMIEDFKAQQTSKQEEIAR
jgi:nucleoside-diphosphate-sugar epimerase